MTKKLPRCNVCGMTMSTVDSHFGFSTYKKLGYGTKYDGCTMMLRVCCNCVEEFIDKCTISPIIDGVDIEKCGL